MADDFLDRYCEVFVETFSGCEACREACKRDGIAMFPMAGPEAGAQLCESCRRKIDGWARENVPMAVDEDG